MYTVQKRAHGAKKWEKVGESNNLHVAIILAKALEERAPADQAREFDVSTRVVVGRKVVWS